MISVAKMWLCRGAHQTFHPPLHLCTIVRHRAPVAKLDKASVYETEDCWFESSRVRHHLPGLLRSAADWGHVLS